VPSNASLLQSIRLRLGRHLSPSFGTATDIADLYEAYIFSLVIRAAFNEGADPEQGGSLTFRDPRSRHGEQDMKFTISTLYYI
jgi:hypothetical protein